MTRPTPEPTESPSCEGRDDEHESTPPPSGLATHAKLARSRQLVLVAMEQLCERTAALPIAQRAAPHEAGVLAVMIAELLERQLAFETAELQGIAFPLMSELVQRQRSVTIRHEAVLRAIRSDATPSVLAGLSTELRHVAVQYFDWLDSVFAR